MAYYDLTAAERHAASEDAHFFGGLITSKTRRGPRCDHHVCVGILLQHDFRRRPALTCGVITGWGPKRVVTWPATPSITAGAELLYGT